MIAVSDSQDLGSDDTAEQTTATGPEDPRAKEHMDQSRGGHWWTAEDVDPPEYAQKDEDSVQNASQRDAGPESLPEEHRPDLDDDLDWDEYSQYWCVICRDNCINKTRSVYARAKECRHCFVVPTADRHSVDDLDER